MTDDSGKVETQAVGQDRPAATPDGTNATDGAGESGGGAYPNPRDGEDKGGFEGGQTVRDYHGGPGGTDNHATGTK